MSERGPSGALQIDGRQNSSNLGRPPIQVKNLVKSYGSGRRAVDDISFDVLSGETFGLIGPNGAGKTSTVEAIEAMLSFDSGQVLVGGRDVTKQPLEVRRSIGIQLQASAYFDKLNLVELLSLLRDLYSCDSDPMDLLGMVGLK